MPAESKAQKRFMQMCEHNPQHAQGKCPSREVAREFSRTPTKDLPRRVKKR